MTQQSVNLCIMLKGKGEVFLKLEKGRQQYTFGVFFVPNNPEWERLLHGNCPNFWVCSFLSPWKKYRQWRKKKQETGSGIMQ